MHEGTQSAVADGLARSKELVLRSCREVGCRRSTTVARPCLTSSVPRYPSMHIFCPYGGTTNAGRGSRMRLPASVWVGISIPQNTLFFQDLSLLLPTKHRQKGPQIIDPHTEHALRCRPFLSLTKSDPQQLVSEESTCYVIP